MLETGYDVTPHLLVGFGGHLNVGKRGSRRPAFGPEGALHLRLSHTLPSPAVR